MQDTKKLAFVAVPPKPRGWRGAVWLAGQVKKPHRTQKANAYYVRACLVAVALLSVIHFGFQVSGSGWFGLGMWVALMIAVPNLFSFVAINRRIDLTFKIAVRDMRKLDRARREELAAKNQLLNLYRDRDNTLLALHEMSTK